MFTLLLLTFEKGCQLESPPKVHGTFWGVLYFSTFITFSDPIIAILSNASLVEPLDGFSLVFFYLSGHPVSKL